MWKPLFPPLSLRRKRGRPRVPSPGLWWNSYHQLPCLRIPTEAEKVWETFEKFDTFPITYDDIIALGKDPDTAVRYPNENFGLGEEAYVASLDVQHKIHCLNELRKMTFADYNKSAPKKKVHGQLWWIYLRHCVDMLTQDILYHTDADIVIYR